MKKYYFLIILVLILGLVLTGCLLSNVGQVPTSEQSGITYLTKGVPGVPDVFTLYAGQHIDVGTVSVWDDCDDLYVKYETTGGWVMTETHLAVVADEEDFPMTKKDNPIPGQFPYQCCYDETEEEWLFVKKPDTLTGTCDEDGEEDATLTEITYTIPLTWGICAELFIAAHAVVEKQIEGEIIQEETAWGAGIDFPGKNWATYFTYNIITELTISSEDLAGPYTKDEDGEFSVKTVNPSCGSSYEHVLFNYIIEGVDLSGINTFDYWYFDDDTSIWKWGEMPKENDGSGNVTGFFGPFPGCFLMEVDYSEETTFRINIGIVGTFLVTITLINCENNEVLATLSETVVVFPETLEIGDSYGGGIVAYIDGTGQHGLIAATADQSTGTEWGCYGVSISGADGITVGTGEQNTIDIEAGCATTGTAADICANLSLGGYSDWFLPSKDELNLMYTNLKVAGVGGFADGSYWSSSEFSAYYAWRQSFGSGVQYYTNKGLEFWVRAVRAF